MRRSLRLVLACACLAACVGGASEGQGAWAAAIDTVNGVIRVRNPARPRCVTPGHVERDLTIGTASGDASYEFAKVWDVAADERGGIYVADPGRREVLAYDSTGRFRRIIGRSGEGPGEFRAPTGVEWRDGVLAVLDYVVSRVSFFTADGVLVRDTTLRGVRYPGSFAWPMSHRLLVQVGPNWMSPPVPGEYGIGRLLSIGLGTTNALDTFVVWSDSGASAHFAAPGVSLVAEVPFGARAVWAPNHDGGVFFAKGTDYTIRQYGPDGAVRREIQRLHTRISVSARERDSVQARVASYDRRLAERIRVPPTKAAVRGLQVDDRGRLWVRVSRDREGQDQQWDVFVADGTYSFTLFLPAGGDVKLIHGSRIYAVATDSLGVAQVDRYRYSGPC
ncbi:MAG: 6-bladed beta-propeller [Candidatus Methylomirabilaceae bacterium]